MCTHKKWITNLYTHDHFLVDCGKCPACLQKKAYGRSSRIKAEYSKDKICLFVTLTYDRASCPHVLQSDVDHRVSPLPVYRDFFTRRVRRVLDGKMRYYDKRTYKKTLLNEIHAPDYESFDNKPKIRHLAFRNNYIGICYYPDVQLFKKRLNSNLRRKYFYNEKIVCYSCSEYGGTTKRPHFHLLFFIRPCDEALFRTAIPEAWPFSSRTRTSRWIEVARDAANYVASYVNCSNFVHPFLSKVAKAKHSYSKDFGCSSKLFSLDSILQMVERKDMSYLRPVGQRGKEQYVNFSIPKYVVNRYFPLFKGFTRIADTSILDVLRSFILCGFSEKQQLSLNCLNSLNGLDYNSLDFHQVPIRLRNAYIKFHSRTGRSIDDYCRFYVDAWKTFRFTNFRLWATDDKVDPKYKYDNVFALLYGYVDSPDTFEYLDSSPGEWIANPNEFPDNKSETALYEQVYSFRSKEKNINAYTMAHRYYYV